MKIVRLIIFGLMFLAILAAGTLTAQAAFGVNLSVNTPTQTVGPGENATYTLTITNTGNQTDSYILTSNPNNADSITLEPNTISNLAANSPTAATLKVRNNADGTFTVKVTATSQGNSSVSATIPTTTTVQSQYGVWLTVTPSSQTAAPGVNATYNLTVKNTGNVPDTYNLSYTNPQNASVAGLSLTQVTLNPLVSQSLTLNVANTSNGVFTVVVTATSQGNSSVTATIPTTTTVQSQYGVDLSVVGLSSKTAAPGVNATYNLTVKNTGNVPDTYNLSYTNPQNASVAGLSLTQVTLNPLVSQSLTLNVANTSNGVFTVVVTATSQGNSSVTATIPTTTTVQSQYGVELTVTPSSQTAAPGVNATYNLTVKNTGNVPDTYNLSYTNPQNASVAGLSLTQVTLNPLVSQSLTLNVANTSNGVFTVDVTAVSQGNSSVTGTATTTTTVQSVYSIGLTVDSSNKTTDFKVPVTFVLTVKNTGNVPDTINLSITDNPGGLTISLSKTSLDLDPSKSENVNMNVSSNKDGTFAITVTATSKGNSSVSKKITVTLVVRPKFYSSGNRVWDETKGLSRTYTWTPQSFPGFFYDLDNNVGTENITIKNIGRSIREGDLEYTTSPQLISFDYSTWGRYQVIGFMAEKYFAGYVAGETKEITDDTISTLNSKQLHKVLLDDETKRVLYAGSTLSLKDGYALKAKDVDVTARIILLALIKDGDEVDIQPVEAGKTYVYTKKVGSVSELPIIAVHFDSVFSGREVNAAFIKGIFQLSESYLTVNTGTRYGIMEIRTVSAGGIVMENDASISLSEGSTIDLMGDIKIRVADNSSVLRFAPFVQKTGTYELRGTVVTENDTPFTWTPMNFEGFYYDLDADVGNESLEINPSGRTVSKDNLKYSTTPQLVGFDYSKWGSYRVIGFMAEKFFAGFVKDVTHSDITSDTVSTLNSRQLHKVLLDDETKRVLYAGSTLSLKDGYALKAKDVDVTARIILLALLKDGNEVDIQPVEAGKTYVYTKKVGSISELPVLAVHFDSVFSGREVNAAFIRGIFQISESYITVNTGTSYGIMEVRSVSDTGIIMENDASFDLSAGSTIDVMGKIKFKAADSGDIRYYPYIMVNGSELATNQLVIDAPEKVAVKDNITIKVTAGGSPIEGASLTLGITDIGNTDSRGILNYTLTKSGTFNLTATKLGYERATKTIVVEEFATNRLVIDIPSKANQGEVLTIKVTANNTPIPGVNITFDNKEIGLTNSLGILNYTLTVTGTHTIGAYKTGYRTAAKDIDIRAPYSEFVGSELNITPTRVAVNQPVLVKVNVTNIGTKADLHIVELRINESVADTRNITLKPGEVIGVNFTYMPPKPGNFTVEVGGQTGKLEVYEEGLSLMLIGGIATLLGAVAVYLYTMRPGTIGEIRRKMGGLSSSLGSKFTRHKPKTKQM